MKIILLGYMASGKSFIGEKIAKLLKYDFVDLDNYIENREKKTVKSIFEDNGELYFRKKEHLYLKELLDRNNKMVLSLGGGTPCYYNNMNMITSIENVTSIYLRVSIPEIVKRVKSEKAKRPLIAHIETEELLIEFIGKHLFERSNYYNQADIVIDANEDASAIMESLLVKLF